MDVLHAILSLNQVTSLLYETTRRWPCKENPISESGTHSPTSWEVSFNTFEDHLNDVVVNEARMPSLALLIGLHSHLRPILEARVLTHDILG